MAGISIKTEVKGIPQLTRVLNVLTRKIQSRTDLNARWAVLTLNWINRNFATEGGMVGGWKPLSPNTLAARRSGARFGHRPPPAPQAGGRKISPINPVGSRAT